VTPSDTGSASLRVCVVTNGSWFATQALGRLLTRTSERHEYSIVVTTGLRQPGSDGRASEAVRLLRRWGPRYFGYKILVNLLPQVLRFGGRHAVTLESICSRRGIPVSRASDVHEPDALREIERFGPDVLVSFSCPYRLRSEVLEVPRIGALNVHSSLLPAYAGIATYVHCLVNDEPRTGVTVHEMVERFDAGRIVGQRAIDIRPGTSVFELFKEQCLGGADLLVEALDEIAQLGRLTGRPQDLAERTYFGEPTRADIRALRRNGFVLATWKDLREIVRTSVD
jgi:folate-dependent phosphoribosylglycinamide formyltransferase PurN